MDSFEEISNNGSLETKPSFFNIETFTKDGYNILKNAVKNSNNFPLGNDWNYYNTYDSFINLIESNRNSILQTMNDILKYYEINNNFKNKTVNAQVDLIIEANDVILEQVANNIDELNGIKRKNLNLIEIGADSSQHKNLVDTSWNIQNKPKFITNTVTKNNITNVSMNSIILPGKNTVKPQKYFKIKPDNSNQPWKPSIFEKPNSLKPLAIFLETYDNREEFSHPYELELERFMPINGQLIENKNPAYPKSLRDTQLVEIDKEEQLDDLILTLNNTKEFAVDLEHHSYRSFLGITCLMQISTTEKDYIIDTLALKDKLYILNEVFTKPTIVKIFHGSDLDIEWLQRDLSIYVVNMFDTHQAAKILNFTGLSLSYLLLKYCNVIANKQYQLADWRIRPLPDELKTYAREDTHYLIYIYEMLKKELLSHGSDNLLLTVINRSRDICKKRFCKPILNEESHLEIYRRSKKLFDNRQMYALKKIYVWRDTIARQEDESISFVLPNHMLLQISESLPREIQGILACCNPIPSLVRSHLLDLHKIILKAREQPLEKSILKEDIRDRGTIKALFKVNIDSPLHCPHDLTESLEFRDDLPTLIEHSLNKSFSSKVLHLEKELSNYSVFNSDNISNEYNVKKLNNLNYLSPFKRYKLVKPVLLANEEKQEKEQVDIVQSDPNNKYVCGVFPKLQTSSIKNKSEDKPNMKDVSLNKKKKFKNQKIKHDYNNSKIKNVIQQNCGSNNTSINRNSVNKNKNIINLISNENENGYIVSQSNKRKKFKLDDYNNIQAFNYSSVDFRQFQGGASKIDNTQKINYKFKGKHHSKKKNKS